MNSSAPARERLIGKQGSETQMFAPKGVSKKATSSLHRPGSLFGANLANAWEAVGMNLMRSLLTMLGIIIGVAAVVGSLNMTQGVSNFIANYTLQNGGATHITISGLPTNTTQKQRNAAQVRSHPSLIVQDVQTLHQLTHVTEVSPTIFLSEQAIYGNQKWRTQIVGVSPDFLALENLEIAGGVWLSETDDIRGASVAVIGNTVANKLFSASGDDPLGKNVRIRGQLLRVVGVLAPKGIDQFDNIIVVPFRTMQNRLTNDSYFSYVILSVDDINNVDQGVAEITEALKRNHHIQDNDALDFTTTTSAQQLQQTNQILGTLGILFAGVAAISLVIGGIVIMNIMLISVTERTQEIGIRIALGARRRDILNQFLIEALVLCLIGGVIGMLLGWLIGWEMSNFMIAALGSSNQVAPFSVSLPTLLVPFLVSLVIGVVFGLYPAIHASRLEPIIAIRQPK